jgi:hypothetical protein
MQKYINREFDALDSNSIRATSSQLAVYYNNAVSTTSAKAATKKPHMAYIQCSHQTAGQLDRLSIQARQIAD